MKDKELDVVEDREEGHVDTVTPVEDRDREEGHVDAITPVEKSEEDLTVEVLDDLDQTEDAEPDEEEEEDQELEEDEREKLREENRELRNRILRAHADLENFKKRSIRDRQESVRFANKDVFFQLLDVMDNFERALLSAEDPKDNFVIGVAMIQKQLIEVLTNNGVDEIDATDQTFDPYLHEAIAREETDEVEDNQVLEVFQKGYRFHGTLLRPAKVKVAVMLAAEPQSSEETEPED